MKNMMRMPHSESLLAYEVDSSAYRLDRTNGELLNYDQSTSLLPLRDLRQIDRNLRRRYTHGDAVEQATNNQHRNSIASRLESGSDHPGNTRDSNRVTSAPPVGDGTGDEGSKNRSSSQSRVYSSLHDSGWVIEVVDVLLGADLSGHGRDVEAKQRSAQSCDQRDEPWVVDPGQFYSKDRHGCESLKDDDGQA